MASNGGRNMIQHYILSLENCIGLKGVVIIQGAMPIAVLNYLLAARFNNMPSFVASLVLLSTLLTFITIPLVLLFVL